MNANEVARSIKEIIDDYWKNDISETEAQAQIRNVLSDGENRLKVFRGREKTSVFTRVMGTKRLTTFEKLVEGMEF